LSAIGTEVRPEAGAGEVPAPPPVPPSVERLGQAIDRSSGGPRADHRAAMLFLGTLALFLGFAAIGLGWYGAAHSPYLFQEIPYVISGGLLGIALVVAGGCMILGSWVVRMLEEVQRAGSRLEAITTQLARAADREGEPLP
jgi:hypothetical protein